MQPELPRDHLHFLFAANIAHIAHRVCAYIDIHGQILIAHRAAGPKRGVFSITKWMCSVLILWGIRSTVLLS